MTHFALRFCVPCCYGRVVYAQVYHIHSVLNIEIHIPFVRREVVYYFIVFIHSIGSSCVCSTDNNAKHNNNLNIVGNINAMNTIMLCTVMVFDIIIH